MTLVLALSYSSRWEITNAVQNIAREVKEGLLKPEDISEKIISQHLNTAAWPDPELLIRTSGEARVSNYLLWASPMPNYTLHKNYGRISAGKIFMKPS